VRPHFQTVSYKQGLGTALLHVSHLNGARTLCGNPIDEDWFRASLLVFINNGEHACLVCTHELEAINKEVQCV
jgi:hypothetical protein